MKEFHYTIQAINGIHAVPACKLSAEVRHFDCRVTMTKNSKTIEMSDVIELMGLNVKKGDRVLIRAEGFDEIKAIAHMQMIMEAEL